jgi:transposase
MNSQTKAMQESSQVVTEEEAQHSPSSTRSLIGAVKRQTRKRFSSEEKIRIVLEGFSRELPVSDLCRKENISTALYYSWLKDFMEAGKSRLTGDTTRNATSREVNELRRENSKLKEILAEVTLEKELLKKSLKA